MIWWLLLSRAVEGYEAAHRASVMHDCLAAMCVILRQVALQARRCMTWDGAREVL